MGVIFDLDQTLIHSIAADPLRRARKWSEVYGLVPTLLPYDGVTDLISDLLDRDVPLCIVTSAPRPYYERIRNYHGWKIEHSVCYHDTKLHKPHSAPIDRGVELMDVESSAVYAVGDDPKDIAAAHSAGVQSIAVTWGAVEPDALQAASPNMVFDSVPELRDFLLGEFS